MSDSFQLAVVVDFADGSKTHIRMKGFERQEDAEAEYREMQDGLIGLLQTGKIVATEADGSKTSPCTLAQFLATIGVAHIGHAVFKVPLHGALVLSARPNLVQLQ